MILSDRDIKKAMDEGRITIDPLFPGSIQPASVDLHLGADFLIRIFFAFKVLNGFGF